MSRGSENIKNVTFVLDSAGASGATLAEIQGALGIPLGTVSSVLHSLGGQKIATCNSARPRKYFLAKYGGNAFGKAPPGEPETSLQLLILINGKSHAVSLVEAKKLHAQLSSFFGPHSV